MKTTLLLVGKITSATLEDMINDYVVRVSRFSPIELEVIPELRNARAMSKEQQKEREGLSILDKVRPSDFLILLDERGREMSSMDFAGYVERMQMNGATRNIFVIGGPYGFSSAVYARANDKISLSKMTFSHQMIRLLFVEQYYRAHTIINNLPYHHQ